MNTDFQTLSMTRKCGNRIFTDKMCEGIQGEIDEQIKDREQDREGDHPHGWVNGKAEDGDDDFLWVVEQVPGIETDETTQIHTETAQP